jgi:hypothetical protein
MASRSSSGIGVGITITLLGVVCLALFITTIVFLSKYNATRKSLTDMQTTTSEFVADHERSNDAIRRIATTARGANKSVVGYLNESLQTTMQRVTGSRNETAESLAGKIKDIQGASSSSLLGVIRDRDASIANLQMQLEQANKDRQTALANQENEAARVRQLNETHQRTIAALNTDIQRYKDEVDQYRSGVNESKNFMNSEIEKLRDRFAQAEGALNERIRGIETENLQLKDQLAKLRGDKNRDILKGAPEGTLVDGSIIQIDPANQAVTIDRGRKDRIVLGMRFPVYADATAVRPNAAGEYPVGKSVIEVISVGESSSTARVISETRGNPVVRGDVVANAVYDPKKVYTFLVYGNFDANRDGIDTPAEAEDVKALIQQWGGKVTAELTGDVDFLVLGTRPILPPRPSVDAPIVVMQEFMRLDTMATRYDELFRQATSTSIPVLNENRLYTLIGGHPSTR